MHLVDSHMERSLILDAEARQVSLFRAFHALHGLVLVLIIHMADVCALVLFLEVTNRHEEDAIIRLFMTNLLLHLICPSLVVVAPGLLPLSASPRVSDLHKPMGSARCVIDLIGSD